MLSGRSKNLIAINNSHKSAGDAAPLFYYANASESEQPNAAAFSARQERENPTFTLGWLRAATSAEMSNLHPIPANLRLDGRSTQTLPHVCTRRKHFPSGIVRASHHHIWLMQNLNAKFTPKLLQGKVRLFRWGARYYAIYFVIFTDYLKKHYISL